MPGAYEKLLVPLNFPPYPFRLQEKDGKLYIFDELRKKYLVCTPEEWVRQHLLQYMVQQKKYPPGLISIEGGLSVNERKRRSDLLFFNSRGEKYLLAECKSPSVKISNKVFDQAALYNSLHKAKHLMVTNGLEHYCCEMDYERSSYSFIPGIPFFTR